MGAETALAAGSLTASSIGAVASFAQAAKQNKLMKQAQADAQKAMDDARAKLDVNYYKQLAIQKEPYELEREALLSSGAQAIQAGVESERGAAATAGRIQMAQIEGQAGQRTAMGKELSNLAKLTVDEETRLRDEKAMLDLYEAKGQQQAARDAQSAKTAAITQGFAGLTSAIGQGAKLISLYPKQKQDLLKEVAFDPNKDIKSDTGNVFDDSSITGSFDQPNNNITSTSNPPSFLPRNFNSMTQEEYNNFLSTLTPSQVDELTRYTGNINPFGF